MASIDDLNPTIDSGRKREMTASSEPPIPLNLAAGEDRKVDRVSSCPILAFHHQ